MRKLVFALLLTALVPLVTSAAPSPEELAKRQARSVHLWWQPSRTGSFAAQGTVTVTENQTNTYYCIMAWDGGYCGIQDVRGEHILIFSVWDPGSPFDSSARPDAVKEEIRAKVLYSAPNVNVARFGGEGTGARTMANVQWKLNEPVTVKVESSMDGSDRVAFTCYWKNPKAGEDGWYKVASISTLLHGRKPGVNSLYSFLEDFWRNYHSATVSRCAEYSNLATQRSPGAPWQPITSAVFTADSTPSQAIDGGRASNGAFFLKTGGATVNTHARLFTPID